jgi:uncharacterized membrane protein YgcG
LKNGWVLTAAIDDIKGVHLYRGRDLNAALITPTCTGIIISGCVRPNPARGIMNQLESSADSRFDSLTLGFRERFKTLNVFGYYTFSRNLTDTAGPNILPSNNYDLRADWGYSPQQVRHRVQTTLNYTAPHGLLVFVNTVWHTGNPYNQVLNSPGEDGKYNQRLPGVPINSQIGPQNLNVGFNVNKTFMLREATGPANPNQNNRRDQGPGGRGRPGGPPPAGGFRGGPGAARGGGGGGGNPGGAPGLGPGGVSLTLFANTFNILNYTNLNNPSGVIGTPFYGIPTSKNNPRIVELGARLNF